jgi:hypothetical protein
MNRIGQDCAFPPFHFVRCSAHLGGYSSCRMAEVFEHSVFLSVGGTDTQA